MARGGNKGRSCLFASKSKRFVRHNHEENTYIIIGLTCQMTEDFRGFLWRACYHHELKQKIVIVNKKYCYNKLL